MGKSRIEYIINPDGTPGESWGPYSGSRHTQNECATALLCWARSMAKRFPQVAGGDFQPRFHPQRLEEPLHWRSPRRVAVCFMGDLFGDWQRVEAVEDRPKVKEWDMAEVRRQILALVRKCPQHTFLFLTKAPQNLAKWNPWPDNAWVGASACDADSFFWAYHHLRSVEAKTKWISLEPLLGPPNKGHLLAACEVINWLVIGAQSGPGAVKPRKEWVYEIAGAAVRAGIPIWFKENLRKLYPELRRQALPPESFGRKDEGQELPGVQKTDKEA